jgi:hypothetical protein
MNYNRGSKSNDHYLYMLKDPVSLKIKYIGITQDIGNRYRLHKYVPSEKSRSPKLNEWFLELHLKKLKPIFEVIKKYPSFNEAHKMEILLIKQIGDNLLNVHHNG